MKLLIILCFLFISCSSTNSKMYTIRLKPNDDVKKSLLQFAKTKNLKAATIVMGVGSLTHYHLRFSNQKQGTQKQGTFEIVSLNGTLSQEGMHVHMSVSDDQGLTVGGHLLDENYVYSTLEITLIEDLKNEFKKIHDPTFGYQELLVVPRN